MRRAIEILRTTGLLPALLLIGCLGDRAAASEVDKIAEVLPIESGMKVADVGAGDGEWSLAIARLVGQEGRIFATEVANDELRTIERKVERSGLSNITVVTGNQEDSGLPEACCDAILLRLVYHHFVDPTSMLASLRGALLPGGHLAVIDITPQQHWRALEGVPDRGGHGIAPEQLIEEMGERGFQLVARHDDWNDDPDRFCVIFRVASRSAP